MVVKYISSETDFGRRSKTLGALFPTVERLSHVYVANSLINPNPLSQGVMAANRFQPTMSFSVLQGTQQPRHVPSALEIPVASGGSLQISQRLLI